MIDSIGMLQLFAEFATACGVIFAAHHFWFVTRKESKDREYGTYDSLDNKYIEFMYHAAKAENVDLDIHTIPKNRSDEPDEDLIIRERASFAVLISIFERALVMYEERASDKMKTNQYEGWIKCIKSYCDRPSFIAEWKAICEQFDKPFKDKLNTLMGLDTPDNPERLSKLDATPGAQPQANHPDRPAPR